MYQAAGIIRDYNQATDTCSVEITGAGIIDSWLDNIHIASAVNRALIVAGITCGLTMPDAAQLCEAQVTSLNTGIGPAANYSGSVAQRVQSARIAVTTNNLGNGSSTCVWPTPFSVAPTSIYAAPDNIGTVTVSAISATQCTLTLAGGPASSTAYITVQAQGAQ